MAQILIDYGANVKVFDYKNRGCAKVAKDKGHKDIIEVMKNVFIYNLNQFLRDVETGKYEKGK